MVLVGAIPHIFGINTDPALVQVIGGQTIDEIKVSNSITYESSILILLIKGFFWVSVEFTRIKFLDK